MHEGLPKARSEKDYSQGTSFSRLAIFDMPPIAGLDLKLVSGEQEKIPVFLIRRHQEETQL
jgi:hypothetical protein